MSNWLLGVWSGQVDKKWEAGLEIVLGLVEDLRLDGTEVGSHGYVEWDDMDARRRIRWRSANPHLRHYFFCLLLWAGRLLQPPIAVYHCRISVRKSELARRISSARRGSPCWDSRSMDGNFLDTPISKNQSECISHLLLCLVPAAIFLSHQLVICVNTSHGCSPES
jgi:hypothetical protein